MAVQKVHTTDVGTFIKLDTGTSLAGAVTQKIIAKRPTGALVDLEATIVETTKLRHTKTADTLNEAGEWELQSYVEFSPTQKFKGVAVGLYIYPPLS